jgi:hypothetical protein
VRLAKEKGAYGFFYQQHTNTYQIVGFYADADAMDGTYANHGHSRGLIGVLNSCPALAKFDEETEYSGTSSDNYWNYCQL